ncbi:MAG: transposase, partial [Geminicoccaceae bacterium]
ADSRGHRRCRPCCLCAWVAALEPSRRVRDDLQRRALRTSLPTFGQPAEAPWRLALATLLQFMAGLPEGQAANAVRSHIEKYLLALPLTDPGFDRTVRCEFRAPLVAGGAAHYWFDAVLAIAVARKLVRAKGRQRTASTHVLAAVRALNCISFYLI